MGKGFWEHMVADSTSWVQDSNERLKEYLEGSLSKAGLESFVTVMPRRDGYRIYAGEKPDAPFAYVDVYLDGNALVVAGSSKRHLSEQEMGDLARFLGISGSEAGEKLNRFRKFIDALQKHAGEDVDKLEDLKVSDACDKAVKGQKIGKAVSKAKVRDFARAEDVVVVPALESAPAYAAWFDELGSDQQLAVLEYLYQYDSDASENLLAHSFKGMAVLYAAAFLQDVSSVSEDISKALSMLSASIEAGRVDTSDSTLEYSFEDDNFYSLNRDDFLNALDQVEGLSSILFENAGKLQGNKIPVSSESTPLSTHIDELSAASDKAADSAAVPASTEVYLVHDGDMSFDDAADIISSFNTDYSLEDGLLWVSEKWVDPSDSATEVNLSLAAGILGIANGDDVVASDFYDSMSDDEVYAKLAVKDLVVQVYTSDHREDHEFIYKAPSHELLRKVVRTVLFFSEARDSYKDTYEGLKKILPAAHISDSVSVNFKNSKGGSAVRQLSGERVGKPVDKARPVRDSKASEVAKIDKALDLVRNAYKSTGKKSEVKGMSLDIKGLDGAVVDLKAYKSGKEDKIAVEIRWKDGERKGFDYGIDAKASHVYGDIVSLKKVADSLEDPTEDLIGVAKEGDITYAEVESIFSANGVTPSLDDRTLWVNYKWDDPEASGDTVLLDLSSGLEGIGAVDEYEPLLSMPEDSFMQDIKVDYVLVQTRLYSEAKDTETEYNEFYYKNPSKFTLDRISRVAKAVSIMASSYEGTVHLLEASLPKEGRVSDSVHVDIKNRKGGAPVRQIDGSRIGKPVAKARPVRDSKLAGGEIAKSASKANVRVFASASALVSFQNAWAKLQSNSELQKAKSFINYMGELTPVELVRKGADDVDVCVNGKSVGSYDLKKDSADYVFYDLIGRDVAMVGDHVDKGLSKTSDDVDFAARVVPQTKVYIKDFLTTDPYGHSGDAGVVLGRLDVDPDTVVVSFESGAPVALYDIDAIELDMAAVSDSVEDVASLVASLESDSSLANQRRVADIMLKNDMHVLKDGRKEIMVIANADTDIPLFSFKQHAWTNIHDKASDSEKRSDFVFPADSSDVNDGKGHFPLNSLRRARAAIAYANKYQELPTWYSGDLDLKGFVNKIVSEVKKQYPSIEISPESYIPAPAQK